MRFPNDTRPWTEEPQPSGDSGELPVESYLEYCTSLGFGPARITMPDDDTWWVMIPSDEQATMPSMIRFPDGSTYRIEKVSGPKPIAEMTRDEVVEALMDEGIDPFDLAEAVEKRRAEIKLGATKQEEEVKGHGID